jgi:hypothetical protein
MRYLKLYEEFITQEPEETEVLQDQDLSDKTIDDVLKDDFFDESEEEVFQDQKGVYHIKNWTIY